jgi:hypothetical protein
VAEAATVVIAPVMLQIRACCRGQRSVVRQPRRTPWRCRRRPTPRAQEGLPGVMGGEGGREQRCQWRPNRPSSAAPAAYCHEHAPLGFVLLGARRWWIIANFCQVSCWARSPPVRAAFRSISRAASEALHRPLASIPYGRRISASSSRAAASVGSGLL